MLLLVAKVVGTPLLIVLVSLVARRFGPSAGGLLAGLPLASGPVAGLLVAAHGPAFGLGAAQGILLGLFGAQAFVAAYAWLSPHAAWPLVLAASFAAFALVAAAAYASAPPLALIVPVVLAGLLAINRGLGRPGVRRLGPSDRGWPDLLLRAVLATALVVGLTAAAPLLGARLSGILAPVPIATAILAVFTHRTAGSAGARDLLRGVAGGAYSFWAFFTVLCLTLTRIDTLGAFALATAAALALQAARAGARRARRRTALPSPAA